MQIGGGVEGKGEGDRIRSRLSLSAQSPAWGPGLPIATVRSWPAPKSGVRLGHLGTPNLVLYRQWSRLQRGLQREPGTTLYTLSGKYSSDHHLSPGSLNGAPGLQVHSLPYQPAGGCPSLLSENSLILSGIKPKLFPPGIISLSPSLICLGNPSSTFSA